MPLLRFGLAIMLATGATACGDRRASAGERYPECQRDQRRYRGGTNDAVAVAPLEPELDDGSISAYSPYKDYGSGPQTP